MKLTVLIIALLFSSITWAKKAPGYIVDHFNDTTFGDVKLHKFERVTGAFLINNFDLNWCFFSVSFKGENDKRFKNYKPYEIKEYSFTYNSKTYSFRSFEVEFIKLINKQDQVSRFLQLIQKGNIQLYRDIIYAPQMAETAKIYTYYDYYLYSPIFGLEKVEASKTIKTVKDLLIKYHVNKDFINSLSPQIRFNDISLILNQYNQWLENKQNP